MKILIRPKNKKNYLVVIAIGKKYYNFWKINFFPLVKKYSLSNGVGVIVITNNLISKSSKYFKKPQWQKLLVGEFLHKKKIIFENLCVVDADILVNPYAPNILNYHSKDKISVVSSRFNMPSDYDKTAKKIAFNRKTFYSKKYPLNSAINMSIESIFKFHNLKSFKNFFCAGLYVLNKKFSKKFKNIFFKYPSNVKSITNGGDQTHVNYEFQKIGKLNWLDYKFQALWNYEMVNYYPFLYFEKNKKLINYCIESSLINNHFLHFAGSWYESKMINNFKPNLLKKKKFIPELKIYLDKKFIGKPYGFIKP